MQGIRLKGDRLKEKLNIPHHREHREHGEKHRDKAS
jgi:hypothetical protein